MYTNIYFDTMTRPLRSLSFYGTVGRMIPRDDNRQTILAAPPNASIPVRVTETRVPQSPDHI